MTNYKIPIAFITVIIIWSSTPLAIQWSSVSAPMSSVMIRMLVGMLFCLAIMGLMGLRLPFDQHARRLYVAGGLSIYAAMVLVYTAAQSIPSGWIAVVFGLSPLITGVIAAFIEPESRLTLIRTTGITLGIMGLYMVFQAGLVYDPGSLLAIILMIIAAFVSSASSVLIRYLSKDNQYHPMQITTGGLVVAIPFFILTAYLLEPTVISAFSNKALISILYLGTIGTGIGFTLYYFLLKHVPASKVALITLITPISSLVIGNLLNNEPLFCLLYTSPSPRDRG